jgi:hypothetical protein
MAQSENEFGTIAGVVTDEGGKKGPIAGAEITVFPGTAEKKQTPKEKPIFHTKTDGAGGFKINVPVGAYTVHCAPFGIWQCTDVTVQRGCLTEVCFQVPVHLRIDTYIFAEGCENVACSRGVVGQPMLAIAFADPKVQGGIQFYKWHPPMGATATQMESGLSGFEFTNHTAGQHQLGVTAMANRPGAMGEDESQLRAHVDFSVSDAPIQMIGGKVGVTLSRTTSVPTRDQALWVAIRDRTRAISFGSYRSFINRVLCHESAKVLENSSMLERQLEELSDHAHGVGAYQVLKTATEVFLLMECGVRIARERFHQDQDEESARLGESVTFDSIKGKLDKYLGMSAQLPYITRVIRAAFPGLETGKIFCDRVLTSRANEPCLLELIWSYWHEEGMLTQTINAVSQRFQNVRGPGDRDPLAHMETDPLRPINNLLWGRIQDEPNRLSVRRRAYEYDHHYGLTLYGKAVSSFRPTDSRSKFLEGFHNLLYQASVFFKEDNDTTVIADGYPLLNSLKEVHLLLAQGAHNQFGDLPWTARAEMLIEEWLLARSELRDFLQSRAMVPYKEPWMPQVDTMKTMQGWSDVTVTHFRDLGVYGEQLLLSVRYGDWIDVNDEDSAKNWARYWRPEMQGYLHAYRAVTGIDLTNPDTVDATMPSVHLQKRLATQQRAR